MQDLLGWSNMIAFETLVRLQTFLSLLFLCIFLSLSLSLCIFVFLSVCIYVSLSLSLSLPLIADALSPAIDPPLIYCNHLPEPFKYQKQLSSTKLLACRQTR